MTSLPLFLRLYIEFFLTGLFSVGGGMATLPFLSDMADKTGWFTQSQLADMVAVAESTPGPIGINTATYVGFTVAGIPGGIISTLGLVTPSIIIIVLISYFLGKFAENKFVKSSFYLLRPASIALITSAVLSLAAMTFFINGEDISIKSLNPLALVIAVIFFIFTNFVKKTKGAHPIIWIGIGALLGILIL